MSGPLVYRRRPLTVEAIRFEKPYWRVKEFCPDITLYKGGASGTLVRLASVETSGGPVRAELGDYIIKGPGGDFYPCKPDIFAKTYELENA